MDEHRSEGPAALRDRALTALMDGRFKRAIGLYHRHVEEHPNDGEALLELACAHAAASHEHEFQAVTRRFSPEKMTPSEAARRKTAQAYFNLRKDLAVDVRRALEEAVRLDAQFPLAHYSLGRHLLWRGKDRDPAKHHLGRAAALAPASGGARLGVVAGEVEDGDYREAARLSRALVREFPLSGRVWLTFALTTVLRTPLSGRLLVLFAAAMLFIKGFGPIMVLGSLSVAILSVRSPESKSQIGHLPRHGAGGIVGDLCAQSNRGWPCLSLAGSRVSPSGRRTSVAAMTFAGLSAGVPVHRGQGSLDTIGETTTFREWVRPLRRHERTRASRQGPWPA